MENAGRNVAEEVIHDYHIQKGSPENLKVAILCGKGNNGGDGYVVARHLYNHYVAVGVFLFAKISDVLREGDAGTNLQILLQMKLPVREILNMADRDSLLPELNTYTLIVDALFGTGLSGDVREPFRTLIHGVNSLKKPVVSVDIPSGLDCNTGKILGAAIMASKTVTFAASKGGFYREDGPAYAGEVVITDISIPRELLYH